MIIKNVIKIYIVLSATYILFSCMGHKNINHISNVIKQKCKQTIYYDIDSLPYLISVDSFYNFNRLIYILKNGQQVKVSDQSNNISLSCSKDSISTFIRNNFNQKEQEEFNYGVVITVLVDMNKKFKDVRITRRYGSMSNFYDNEIKRVTKLAENYLVLKKDIKGCYIITFPFRIR